MSTSSTTAVKQFSLEIIPHSNDSYRSLRESKPAMPQLYQILYYL